MSKFEPKITPLDVSLTRTAIDDWCLRNVTDNLRRFKAEFLLRMEEPDREWATYRGLLNDMIPDDPPKATDTERLDWVEKHGATTNGGVWYVFGKTWRECIDAAMAREKEASK